jgi:hypothetical protein
VTKSFIPVCALALMFAAGQPAFVPASMAQDEPKPAAKPEEEKPDFKPWPEVSKGFEKVVSTAEGDNFYTLWHKKKDNSLLAELPRGYENQKHYIALTVASGEEYAGLQYGEVYCYWKRQDKRLVLIEPNVDTRSTGDQESKTSVKNLFTDRVILDVPIVAMGPSGTPVIDLRNLMVDQGSRFFGGKIAGASTALAAVKKAKSFPQNTEVAWEMPTRGGRLQEFHYSVSLIPDNTGYKPRNADARVGYFTTVYRDLGKFTENEKWVRYINRWNLEKRDPGLDKSPPKQPLVYYIDSAVPVKYRQAVRDGVLGWNKAFERVGLLNAVEVYQQDEATGQHMDKDPEDVRYNFIRWLSNDQGTAIGPSRVHPLTGQILDADVILTDGWIRHFWVQFNEIMPELAVEGMSPETLAWLEKNPQWDPRVRLADPAQRPLILAQRAARGPQPLGGHPLGAALGQACAPGCEHQDHNEHDLGRLVPGNSVFDGLVSRSRQMNTLCAASRGKAFDMAVGQLTLDLLASELADDDKPAPEGEKKDDKKKKEKKNLLDGIPDWFVQPLLRDLVLHEVGHTLGLRHNFKASSQYPLADINSPELLGKKPFAASVMDYIPVNFAVRDGKMQGDVGMIDIGDYDYFAIEYGYTMDDPKEVLKKVGTPGLDYGTDEDTIGPDPLARRYDFAQDPLDYANSQMELARYHRGRLIDKFAKDGESWSRVSRGYNITLGMQMRSLSMMANWVGGVHVNRDRKGDPGNRPPLVVVPAEKQRRALAWTIQNSFFDDAYGLTPQLMERMTTDKWMDFGGYIEASEESGWPVHDRIGGIQSSVLTMLMNPTTVRRVFDNELRVAADQDALTLPELLDTVDKNVWKELDNSPSGVNNRKPYISSLRRNLQREYVDRLVDLTRPESFGGESGKPVANLVTTKLRQTSKRLGDIVGDKGDKQGSLDSYSFAHLAEAKLRIDKALDAQVIYNTEDISGGGFGGFWFGQPTPPAGR